MDVKNEGRHNDRHSDAEPGERRVISPAQQRCRILIVEDNRAIARTIQLLLEHEGYQTRWCEDESLYTVIHEWQPDLILMDLRMPRLDGIEATRVIKSDPSTCAIPVIVVTAEQVTPDGLAMIKANELVPKPFRVAQLLERIRYWISQHTGQHNLGSSMRGGLSHAG